MVLSNTMLIPSYAVGAKLLGIPHYWMVHEFLEETTTSSRFLLAIAGPSGLIGRPSESGDLQFTSKLRRRCSRLDPSMKHVRASTRSSTPWKPARRRSGNRVILMRASCSSVGSLQSKDATVVAVEAVAIARKAGVDIELALIGGGNQKLVRELARRLGGHRGPRESSRTDPTMLDATGPPPMSASSAANAMRRSASSPWRR